MKTQRWNGVAAALALAAAGFAAQEPLDELRPIEMGGYASFGADVSPLHGDVTLVGAPGESARGGESGAVHVLHATVAGWDDELLTAADTAWGDRFGASVDWDGVRAAVGAPKRKGGGGAYIFRLEGGAWIEEAFLPPQEDDPLLDPFYEEQAGFGVSVAVDGDTAVVIERNYAPDFADAAYVYRREGDAWALESKIGEPPGSSGFAPTCALSGGTLFLIQSAFEARVYVYSRDDGGTVSTQDDVWMLHTEIPNPSASQEPRALSVDGDLLAVGVPYSGASSSGYVRVYEREDAGTPAEPLDDVWTLRQKILSPAHPGKQDGFGYSVALRGDVLAVTSKQAEPGPTPSSPPFGAVDVLRLDGTLWQPEAHVTAPAPTADFGGACAVDGDRVLVADAHAEDLGPESGAAWVLGGTGGSWSFAAHLLPQGLQRVGCFGYALDACCDGEALVVGAQTTDSVGPKAGVVYVFDRKAPGWLQSARLVPAGLAAEDRFGSAVAIDGDLLIGGAHQRDEAFADQGAAYVFVRTAGAWTEEAQLVSPDPRPQAYFGGAVALSGDLALVGAYGDDALGEKAGAAYLFRRFGTAWQLEAILHAPGAVANAAFGRSVALEGDRALIGAPGANASTGVGYVFARIGAAWALEQTLVVPDGLPHDQLGFSCALSGERALMGAWRADSVDEDSGAAYVFERDPLQGTWSIEQKLISPAPGFTGDYWYGASVALEGDRAVIGMPTRMQGGSQATAYRLERSEKVAGTWIDVEADGLDGVALPWAAVGLDVALSGPIAAIGAPAVLGTDSFAPPHEFADAGSVVLMSSNTPALVGTPMLLKPDPGGVQTLLLDAPADQAGRAFLVLGSMQGTLPGWTLGAWTLPLNPDSYFQLVLKEPDQPPASGFFGVLDAQGDAQAHVVLPPGLEGLYLYAYHAFVAFDLATGSVTFVSNASRLDVHF